MAECETPHGKAQLIKQAYCEVQEQFLSVLRPYSQKSDFGADEQTLIDKVLLVEYACLFSTSNSGGKSEKHPRLYSNLLFTLLFDVPENEKLLWQLTQDFSWADNNPLLVQNQWQERVGLAKAVAV